MSASGAQLAQKSDQPSLSAQRPRIWTKTFTLLCLAGMLGYIHFGLLTPVLPLYISSLGYSEFVVGLVLAAFSVSSFLMRPFLGLAADRWSVRGVLAMGGVLLGSTGAAFAIPSVWTVGISNTVRGIGWGSQSTGANTLLAHLAPPSRRAEAASYLNLFQSGSTTLVPPIALWLLGAPFGSYGAVFLLSSVCAFVGALCVLPMSRDRTEPSRAPATAAPVSDGLSLDRFYDRGVLLASMMLLCLTLAHPAATAFVPLYARSLGIDLQSVGWYYLAAGVTMLAGPLFLGRVVDRIGRAVVLVVAFTVACLALLRLMTASNLPDLIVAGVLFSLATSLHSPSSMALAIDRANPLRRGTAMASYSMWFQIGSGIGAAVSGVLADVVGYQAMYAVAALGPAGGIVLVLMNWANLRPRRSSTAPTASR